MAGFDKYISTDVGHVFLHNNRTDNDGVEHSNENIDISRTKFNYYEKKGDADLLNERLAEVFKIRQKDAVVLGEFVVTKPHDLKDEDERDFFDTVFEFYCNDFGEKNIINAVVHKDEKTPHIHIDFVPVVPFNIEMNEDGKKISNNVKHELELWRETHNGELPKERLCCKECVNRFYLETMHSRLNKFVKDALGYEVGICNGATINGNKTVLQLKAHNLENDILAAQKRYDALQLDINNLLTTARKNKISEDDLSYLPLVQKIDVLEKQNEILRELITRHGYTWTKKELDDMRAYTKYEPVKSAKVSIFDGTLDSAEILPNAVVVIELKKKNGSIQSPQQLLIEQNNDLKRNCSFAITINEQIVMRKARTTDNIYLFVKNEVDNVQQTINNLMIMNDNLRQINDLYNRRIYFEKMEDDKYDFARSVLSALDANAIMYFNGRRDIESKDKSNEKDIAIEI